MSQYICLSAIVLYIYKGIFIYCSSAEEALWSSQIFMPTKMLSACYWKSSTMCFMHVCQQKLRCLQVQWCFNKESIFSSNLNDTRINKFHTIDLKLLLYD